ncbi:MAG: gluconokinase [Rhodoferax sp.]|nr:gluconokinase [Rhodoferax sp.]
MNSVVIMGVAGCGKSSLGRQVAQTAGIPMIEGDDYHSTANRSKMQQGIALTDADRDGWLGSLCEQMRLHPQGSVVTCSALKRSYRDRLRSAVPGLRFAFLEISKAHAQERVGARAAGHFFAVSLMDSQFSTLENPTGEAGVLVLDAMRELDELQATVCDWLARP